MQRPVWLLSMDSDQFRAPPTTTASLTAYFRRYGRSSPATSIELVHFQSGQEVSGWVTRWIRSELAAARAALERGRQPVVGFSCYTWNAAEFLEAAGQLKAALPELLVIAGGPHVQQAEDYLGQEAIDLVFLGEGEISFQEFLDCDGPADWPGVDGLAWWDGARVRRSASRARCTDLDRLPSPLDALQLTDAEGGPLYDSIAYETSRGCPFKCAFCEWGTGAIGSRMVQWPLERVRSDWERIVAAGIRNIWLADSNFGALKQDLDKARIIVELKQRYGLPLSFATSWSKNHSRRVQEIALLLHNHRLLPHYQLALQTLTPEALRLSNRQNMGANDYRPIAKQMSEQGVPIAAELIWGLPGDNLPDFERNLDQLLGIFPNINIFGYTLLPGTEFYQRRGEYRLETLPVAGYGKARGEYVVGCHSFDRDQGEEGYFLISAHIVLVKGHIMPLTTRLLALRGEVPVSPLLREILRELITALQRNGHLPELSGSDRMAAYEQRDAIFLQALGERTLCYDLIREVLLRHHRERGADASCALQVLALDQTLSPRQGREQVLESNFEFDALLYLRCLESMELPPREAGPALPQTLRVRHPGGLGEILTVADGGSLLRGMVQEDRPDPATPQLQTFSLQAAGKKPATDVRMSQS